MKKIKLLSYLCIFILTLSIAIGCSKGGGGSNKVEGAQKLTVAPKSAKLYSKIEDRKSIQLSITSSTSDGVRYEVIKGGDVVTVSATGLITGVKPGTATVRVTSASGAYDDVKVEVSGSNVIPNEGFGKVEWVLPQSLPITGENIKFTEGVEKYNDNLSIPTTKVSKDDPTSLVGHYRIAYITVYDDKKNKVIDNIVGTGNNMRGEFAVNAEKCDGTIDCPANIGLQIKMQYKAQFSNSIAGIPENFKFVRVDILKALGSLEIDKEFAKLGAETIEDPENPGEYVVKFNVKHTDIPMPDGYTAEITLKKIADDPLLASKIDLDTKEYFSDDDSVKSVNVINTNFALIQDETKQIEYEVLPVNASNKNVTFTSNNESVATVDDKGVVTGISAGNAEITVSTVDGGFTSKSYVRVIDKYVPATSITQRTSGTPTNILYTSPTKGNNKADFYFDVNPANATDKTLKVVSVDDPSVVKAEVVTNNDGSSYLSLTGLPYDSSDKQPEKQVRITIGINDKINNPDTKDISILINVRDDRQEVTSFSILNSNFISNDHNTYTSNKIYYIKKDGRDNIDDSLGLANRKFKLNITAEPASRLEESSKKILFETSDKNVATVDDDGVVTLVAPGDVSITATAAFSQKKPNGEPYVKSEFKFTVVEEYKDVESLSCGDLPTLTIYDNTNKQKLNVLFTPADASERGLNYSLEGENADLVSLNENGEVQYIGQKYDNEKAPGVSEYQDKKVTIRVQSTSNPNVSQTCDINISKVYVKPVSITITNKNEINNKELKAGDYYTGRVQIKTQIEPSNASNKTLLYEVIEGEGVVTVDANGMVYGKKEGTAKVRVKSQAENDIVSEELTFKVWEKVDLTGTYNVQSIKVTYNGNTISSTNQTRFSNDRFYFSMKTSENSIKASAKFQLQWQGFVDNPIWDFLRFKYFNVDDTRPMSDRQMVKETYVDRNIKFNNDDSITYTLPFDISGDKLTYNLNSQNKIEFTLKKDSNSYKETNEYRYSSNTPIDMRDPYTLRGTYDILHFTQSNSMGQATCGTINGWGGVERMKGQLTISISGNNRNRNVSMISKIQMDSSVLQSSGTIVGQCVACGQYAYTVFNGTNVSPNAKSFGNSGSRESGVVTINGNTLVMTQNFSQSIAQVEVKTWMEKKSDIVENLNAGVCYFGKTNGHNSNAINNGYCSAPAKEPHPQDGVVIR